MAELLIVVAIIAVLVAISIPIFNSQLEKAREGTDLANLRNAYAECSTAILTAPASVTGYYKTITLKQQNTDNWIIDVTDVAGQNLSGVAPSACVTVSVAKDGTVTFAATSANASFVDVSTVSGS